MSLRIFWRAASSQLLAVLLLAGALGAALPHSFFESWGWIAGPASWLLCAAAYFLIWPAQSAAQHMLVLSMAAVLLVHRALDQFRKVPFACSYLPGKSNLHVKIGVSRRVYELDSPARSSCTRSRKSEGSSVSKATTNS